MSIKLNSALGGSVTLTEPNTASAFTLTLPTDNIQPGMNLITPTSVVGGTFNGGNISFSAATSVSVNGCFTSMYANYLIICNLTSVTSGTAVVNFKGRTSGIDRTDTYYGGTLTLAHTGTALTGASINAATELRLGAMSAVSSVNTFNSSINICSPQLAQRTTLNWATPCYNGSAFVYENGGAVEYSTLTQLDGFSITASTSSITGTLRIYGLRNQ